MNFNELLKRYNNLKSQIRRCILKQQELRELYSYPRHPVGEVHSRNADSMVNYVAKLSDLELEQVDLEQ